MTRQILDQIVTRAISDAAFRRVLQTNPRSALREYNLSPDEISALTSGDPAKLTALGVDQRMSRLFMITDVPTAIGSDVYSDATPEISETGTAQTPESDRVTFGTGPEGLSRVGTSDPTAAGESSARISHLQQIEADLDTTSAAASGGGPSHLQMVEADLDADAATRPSAATVSHLQQVEADLDADAATRASADTLTHLQQVEGDLDTTVPDQIPNAE